MRRVPERAGELSWAERLLAGDRLALARAITWAENEDARGPELLREVYPHTGQAWVIGVTGAPGAGKSTLVVALAARFAESGRTVGVVAVDPTSPFSGGALLGDRVRWTRRVEGDIFFRSLASRGRLGGLSRAAFDAVRLMDAAGRQVILIETVGAGQAEVDVMRVAHTTVVVAVPGAGDEIQATKAGIMEIGDLFVVNKADREGADDTARDLRMMLGLAPGARGRREGLAAAPVDAAPAGPAAPGSDEEETGGAPGWFPPVLKVSAARGTGVEELVSSLEDHLAYLRGSGRFGRRGQAEDLARMEERFRELVYRDARRASERSGRWAEAAGKLVRREVDPYTAAREARDGL